MEHKLHKKQLRRRILEARQALSAEERSALSKRACRHLSACGRLAESRAIMAFHPFGEELDILPFVDEALRRGQEIWLPLTIPSERRLVPYRYNGSQMLKQGPYGIWEPDPDKAEAVDLSVLDTVLVPGVAFDGNGGRMGYGGGYYDRFLAALGKKPYLIGVGFSLQWVEQVPLEPHDIRLDAGVTEDGFFQS